MMGRFRFGILLGLAIGYVAGSAAGRERFEQLRSLGRRVWDSPTIKPMRDEAGRRVVKLEGSIRQATRRMGATAG